MDYLIGMLDSVLKDRQMAQMVFVVLMAVAVFCLALAGMFLMSTLFHPVRSRLHNVVAPEVGAAPSGGSFTPLLKAIAPYVLPKKEKERSRTAQRLTHAGFRNENALSNFYAIKTLLIVGLPLAVFFGLKWVPGLASLEVIQAAAAAMLLGALGPNYVLGKLVERRKRKLYNGFPDALDLLVVCTEAGYGLKPAIQRVSDELVVGHPELAEELALVNSEMRAGVDRVDALKNLADRTGLEEISGLVALLSQSLRFGTSTAESLRIYSEEFRDKRMQRAEEAAATISTKMVFPLVMCMFPAFFVVAIGPAVVGLLDHFQAW
ncbi:type II secretion system F family protein [Marinobacter sp. NP-4(2019)]|uniref:type II secretion system F family protein n=1 Tax=Marinobacter sp. NP-4(2019) TaxID=2488665 RepID=UPI000FC3D047|nr:type II secretion system F family protein [Marinobacter sp. NP-4(2019)]AZT83235.1 type II secretion system F family protein [Marinobacter sp. NP-4(2019)]